MEFKDIAIIPGGGWMIEFWPDSPDACIEPIVCWVLDSGGYVTARVLSDENSKFASEPEIDSYRIFHPASYEPKGE